MRIRVDFGFGDGEQRIYAYLEAADFQEAAVHARRLRDRIQILEACVVSENAPLPGQTLGVGKKIDASRWLESG